MARVLNELAVAEAGHTNADDTGDPPRGRDAQELPGLGATRDEADGRPLSLGDDLLDLVANLRNASEEGLLKLFPEMGAK